MALDTIPPWLNITPGLYLSAMEGGARAGEAAAGLDERKRESNQEFTLNSQRLAQQQENQGRELDLAGQKLTTGIQESAAERALRERLMKSQQDFNQKKFDVGTQLDSASLGVRRATLDLQREKANLAETKQTHDLEQKSQIDDDASGFWSDVASKTPADVLAQKHPLALKRKDIQQYLTQHAIAERQSAVQTARQKTPMETVELAPDTGQVISRKRTGPVGSPLLGVPGEGSPKNLTKDQAKKFLDQSGGDKEKARELAKDAGYDF